MKYQATIILLVCFIFTFKSQCTTKEDFEAFAHEWINTYVLSSNDHLLVSSQELNILLNVAYFSYKRSASTIAAQDYALHALNANWHLLQNITQTRLNPSHATPYKFELKQYGKLMKQAWDLEQVHESIGSTYAHMLESILEDQSTSYQLQKGIKVMREQARVALIDSLSSIKEYIESLIEECKKKNSDTPNSLDSFALKKGIFDYLLEMIPPLAAQSFAKVDTMSIEASEEGWKVLSEIERIHNLIWMVIEQRRANFYAIMYHSLYAVAKAAKLGNSIFHISFDNEGPIASELQNSSLPDPRKVTLFE